MRGFLAALTMLTVFPLPCFQAQGKDLEKAANFFPLVGLLLGWLLFGFARLLAGADPWVAAVLVVLLSELLTRMLHLDGLADTFDAMFSSRSRERKLEILRDSHIGTMGVFGIAGLLLLKCALLHALPDMGTALLFGVCGGRSALPLYLCCTRYARDEGMALVWYRKKPVWGVLLAAALCGASVQLLPRSFCAVLPAAAVFAVPLLWAFLSQKIFGGATGDTIGCCEELTELAVLGAMLPAAGY